MTEKQKGFNEHQIKWNIECYHYETRRVGEYTSEEKVVSHKVMYTLDMLFESNLPKKNVFALYLWVFEKYTHVYKSVYEYCTCTCEQWYKIT